jgi:6-phosphofructokinase
LPKTIDNDVYGTDVTFGFDTAMEIATEAIDRLHSTAHSHHRIIVVEVMGHNAGWLALGAGIASGADVVLIPEIPYDTDIVATAIRHRQQRGNNFSIVVIAEGALSIEEKNELDTIKTKKQQAKDTGDSKARKRAQEAYTAFSKKRVTHTLHLSQQLEEMTGLESRLTILGHLQRGGTPSASDRVLATRLGSACVKYIEKGEFGAMISLRGEDIELVPLQDVVGKRKIVPLDHNWIDSARSVGTCLGA